ncbi:DUF6643 family protein [Streptacidiphilus monticola]|jgi:hypothetical protein|uniref:DUF6643 family protein n=1 Tax=Streptacidiphilus monticola TaxID=2161674 RepID=A0ABW1G667_9ACTN
MTSRSYDGVGYYAPSFASDTPIYDSLVAERGVPQIAPINVPAALPPAYDSYGSSSFGSSYPTSSYGSNLPALPAPRLALGPGPSSPGYASPQPTPAQTATPVHYGAPQPYIPQQPGPAQPRYPQAPQANGYGTPPGGVQMPQRPVTPVAPVAPQRPAYNQPQQPGYQGGYQSGGYNQGYQGGY